MLTHSRTDLYYQFIVVKFELMPFLTVTSAANKLWLAKLIISTIIKLAKIMNRKQKTII